MASRLLKKSLMENFIFCAMFDPQKVWNVFMKLSFIPLLRLMVSMYKSHRGPLERTIYQITNMCEFWYTAKASY